MDRLVVLDAIRWLEIATLCDRFHVLPNPGGLFQQDESHLMRLRVALTAVDKHDEEKTSGANASPTKHGRPANARGTG